VKKRLLKNAAARDGNIISAAGAMCSLDCWPTTGLFYEGVVTFFLADSGEVASYSRGVLVAILRTHRCWRWAR